MLKSGLFGPLARGCVALATGCLEAARLSIQQRSRIISCIALLDKKCNANYDKKWVEPQRHVLVQMQYAVCEY